VNYVVFLNFLISLGPKLPEVFAKLQHAVADIQDIAAIVNEGEGTLRQVHVAPISKAESKAEAEVMELLAPENEQALFDGTLIRQVLTFVRENPELVAFLLSLFGKKA